MRYTRKEMKRKKLAFLCLFFLLPLVFAGCTGQTTSDVSFFAMDTYFTVSAVCDETVLSGAERIALELDDLLSVTKTSSPISTLNNAGLISHTEIASLVSRCIELSALTDGNFDITVYPAVKAWGFTTDTSRVPTDAEIDTLQSLIDYKKIAVDGDAIRLENGMQIDLGAVAKGYCSDKIVRYLREQNVESAILSLGGNVYALGKKSDGKKWKVAINDPVGNGSVGILEAEDLAVVTSGNYERYFEKDGVRYGHILDPKTARPAESDLLSVSVIGKDGTTCDALSTALFVMGEEKACAFLRNMDVEAVLVTQDGRVLLTPGLDGFTAQGPYVQKVQVISW